jgi:hypothetical protein
MIEKAGLNAEERAVYMRGRHLLDDIARSEMEAEALDQTIRNYSPRLYEAIKDAPGVLFYKKSLGKLGTFLGSSEARVFESLDAAKELGFVPEMNFATLLALRAQNSAKKVAQKQFNEWVDVAFKAEKAAAQNPANPYGKALAKTWNRIADDIQFIGHANYPAGIGEAQDSLAKAYDFLLRKFKGMATVMKPSFGVKQGISNSLQIIMEQGWKAHKIFNPLSIRDAATALLWNNDIVG